MKRIRTFIAIDLPGETKNEISRVLESLSSKKYSQDLRWIEPVQAHITLSFLGSLTHEDLITLQEAVGKVTTICSSFEVKLGGISYYYTDKRGSDSVIFLDVVDEERNIPNLYKMLARELANSGFSPANRVDPHVTIGRLPKRKDRQKQTEILDNITSFFPDFLNSPEKNKVLVDKINIYESVNMPTQTRYRLIRSFPLR